MPSAFAEMEALGHRWVGEEHVLLASLGETGDLQARLAELGLTHQAARDAAAPRMPPAIGDDWRSSEPSYHTAMGRAEGLALALGAARPGAVHKLVAALWEREGPASALLAALDMDRDAVIAATFLPHQSAARGGRAPGHGRGGRLRGRLARAAGLPHRRTRPGGGQGAGGVRAHPRPLCSLDRELSFLPPSPSQAS